MNIISNLRGRNCFALYARFVVWIEGIYNTLMQCYRIVSRGFVNGTLDLRGDVDDVSAIKRRGFHRRIKVKDNLDFA